VQDIICEGYPAQQLLLQLQAELLADSAVTEEQQAKVCTCCL
jgi:hypothetical protein